MCKRSMKRMLNRESCIFIRRAKCMRLPSKPKGSTVTHSNDTNHLLISKMHAYLFSSFLVRFRSFFVFRFSFFVFRFSFFRFSCFVFRFSFVFVFRCLQSSFLGIFVILILINTYLGSILK